MEKHNLNFILTDDQNTADKLMAAGFQLAQTIGDTWLFINDQTKMMFAEGENLRLTYTNKLMF